MNLAKSVDIFIDGACEPNPGKMGIGVVGYNKNKEIFALSFFAGEGTNNIAEYKALIEALNYAVENNYQDILIHTDSQLITNQFSGAWKLSPMPHLRKLCLDAWSLAEKLKKVKIQWIPREKNERADFLSIKALNRKTTSFTPNFSSHKEDEAVIFKKKLQKDKIFQGLVKQGRCWSNKSLDREYHQLLRY